MNNLSLPWLFSFSVGTKSRGSWFIWLWLLLVLFIFGALLLIIWGYRQRHRAGIPDIEFQLKGDAGEQEIYMDPQSPFNSIHFTSQIDKGKQHISLDKAKISERKKSDDRRNSKR